MKAPLPLGRMADRLLASLADGALVTERVARTLGLQAGETEAVVDHFTASTALFVARQLLTMPAHGAKAAVTITYRA